MAAIPIAMKMPIEAGAIEGIPNGGNFLFAREYTHTVISDSGEDFGKDLGLVLISESFIKRLHVGTGAWSDKKKNHEKHSGWVRAYPADVPDVIGNGQPGTSLANARIRFKETYIEFENQGGSERTVAQFFVFQDKRTGTPFVLDDAVAGEFFVAASGYELYKKYIKDGNNVYRLRVKRTAKALDVDGPPPPPALPTNEVQGGNVADGNGTDYDIRVFPAP